VAVLEPVSVAGTVVARSTLHNFDEIDRLGVMIGDTVLIEKSGEIIPKVVKVLKDKRTGRERPFKAPKTCPECGSPAVRDEGGVAFRCGNPSCPALVKTSILHFASRNAMDIEGLGEAVVDQLVARKLIKDYGDIYALTAGEVSALDRMGDKSAGNLIGAIKKSKSNGLARLIFGLGIRHVGVRAAWILAERFGSIKKIASAKIEELTEIHEIGEVMACSVVGFFRDKANMAVLRKLSESGVTMEQRSADRGSLKLAGKTFVVTGTLADYSRNGIESLIRELGGNASSSVSKETDFLVAGEAAGSKLEKAKKFGVKIISEKEFKDMIK
jgi:DNA ligase (NAD+)